MNIYFSGAIRGGRDDVKTYQNLIQLLKTYGTVLTEHVGDDILLKEEQFLTERDIFNRDMQWLADADVLIAEVSTPSLGVGYELAVAERLNIPCLCLFRKQQDRTLSAMISGNSFYQTKTYSENSEFLILIEEFIEQL